VTLAVEGWQVSGVQAGSSLGEGRLPKRLLVEAQVEQVAPRIHNPVSSPVCDREFKSAVSMAAIVP
jgi:hypothetical protein